MRSWSSWPGFELDDSSRTNFGGLGLGLEAAVLEHIPALTTRRGQRYKHTLDQQLDSLLTFAHSSFSSSSVAVPSMTSSPTSGLQRGALPADRKSPTGRKYAVSMETTPAARQLYKPNHQS